MSDVVNEPKKDTKDYSSHKEQILACGPPEERQNQLSSCLLAAYRKVISYKEVPVITFGDLNAEELAEAFVKFPIIIKPTLACVNVAGRAIKRDLGIDLDTYATRISRDHAQLLAGYIKPLLPAQIAVPALMELDRYSWTDKAMREAKGRWEKEVAAAISAAAGRKFKKRTFVVDGQRFEIDIAFPAAGDSIEVAVDVKRIEAQQDTQKRADEVVNKAAKFRRAYPKGKFFAVIYYPFPAQHINLQSRLADDRITKIFFAGETKSSIQVAAEMLVGTLGFSKDESRKPGEDHAGSLFED